MWNAFSPVRGIVVGGSVLSLILVAVTTISNNDGCQAFQLDLHPPRTAGTSTSSLQKEQRANNNRIMGRTRLFNDNYDDGTWIDEDDGQLLSSPEERKRRDFLYNVIGVGLLGASGVAGWSLFNTNVYTPSDFVRLPRTQFIAALGDPKASSGTITESTAWGLWRLDPGPRGVWLKDYQKDIVDASSSTSSATRGENVAPAGWKFDKDDWWLEEHGLIMEAPTFPLPAGRYLVTGGRMVTTGLTIDHDGNWKLDEGTLYDVTHLPCRAARYKPAAATGGDETNIVGSPLTANPKDFPVAPGAVMPTVQGCDKQDYAVLFVVGKAAAAAAASS